MSAQPQPSPPDLIRRRALTRYQQRWLYDKSRRKLLVKSRRIGGTEIVTLESAWKAAGFDPWDRGLDIRRGEHENIISASQDQSTTMLTRYVLRHLRDLEELPRDVERAIPLAKKHSLPLTPEVLLEMAKAIDGAKPNGGHIVSKKRKVGEGLIVAESSERIMLANGREIRAFAANPRTIRGFEGNVTLDEFGAMPYSDLIWAAASPVANPNLGNPKGYSLRIIGTPLGDANQFHRLAVTNTGRAFSRHRVTIFDAVADGFPIDIEEVRAECGDEEIFQQEYACRFMSAAARYLSAELLDRALYLSAGDLHSLLRQHGWGVAGRLPGTQSVNAFSGLDVAGNKDASPTGDPCALVRTYKVMDTYWTDPKIVADRGVSFPTQKEWIRGELSAGVRRVCLDATGVGTMMAQELEAAHPGRVEGVVFTSSVKEDLATLCKRQLENGKLRVPQDDGLRRDLLNLRRTITTAGNTRFDVERDKAGHGDRAWALMLALYAGDQPLPFKPQTGFRR